MRTEKRLPAAVLLLAVSLAGAACDPAENGLIEPSGSAQFSARDSTFSTNPTRTFVQVERLGNPLAMEVFVPKREHGTHDTWPPSLDHIHFTDDYVEFVTKVAGRSEAYGRAIAGALLGTEENKGDKIMFYPNRAAGVTATTAGQSDAVGWLTHVLAPGVGYGGRKLERDDVVDKGLSVIFGTALGNTSNVSPGLVTDNVDSTNPPMRSSFPYFAAANPAP